jgi:chemotaxis protein MotB
MSTGREKPPATGLFPRRDEWEDPMPINAPRSSWRSHRSAHVRSLALLAAGVIAVVGGGSTACVSTGRLNQVEQERDALAARNEALKNEVESATLTGQTLAQEKNSLEAENAALEAKLVPLQTQGEELSSKLREREEEARKLQATYDGLVKSLTKELKAGQIEVTQLRDGLRVNVAQDILFDSGSAALDKNGTTVLNKVATELRKSSHQIVVIGHSDNKPIRPALSKQYPSNWELAGARAASVVRLFNHTGLPSKRLLAVSVADSQPVASNKTEEGRARNRRIEIRLRPVTPEEKSS